MKKIQAKILKTQKNYDEACKRIYQIINSRSGPIDPSNLMVEELELLSLLVEKYEQEHYQLGAPNPIEAIKFRMDQMNLKQTDIAPLFGGKTRVSEILNGRRPLTLKMVALLNRYLGIPIESLIKGSKQFELAPEKEVEFLSHPSIKAYLNKNQEALV